MNSLQVLNNVIPGDDEWYRYLTASRWPHAVGLGWKSRIGVWREMVNRMPPDENDATRWGHENEPHAINALQKAQGMTVVANTSFFIRDGWAGATPDAFVLETGMGVEIKCPFYTVYEEPPMTHLIQSAICMWVLGRQEWLLFHWHPGLIKLWLIKQTPDIEALISWGRDFYDSVEQLIPPRRTKRHEITIDYEIIIGKK